MTNYDKMLLLVKDQDLVNLGSILFKKNEIVFQGIYLLCFDESWLKEFILLFYQHYNKLWTKVTGIIDHGFKGRIL